MEDPYQIFLDRFEPTQEMKSDLQILVPRYIDATNTNAQNLNAKALLSRFRSPCANWVALHYHTPEPTVLQSPHVSAKKLWRTRLWQWHSLLQYQRDVDAIFYPGMDWMDLRGLQLRAVTRRKVPIIGTLEGLVGDQKREEDLSVVAGHNVFCHGRERATGQRIDWILNSCDHIIALTPMLAKLGRHLYGDKFSILPLGIDAQTFRSQKTTAEKRRFRVICAGTLTSKKRPELFLRLGEKFRSADFVWFGQGPLLEQMRSAVAKERLENVTFAGTADPKTLAEEYRRSDLFVLPSLSEGAPKVLQEAGACGLARIAFGFYEPPIANGIDGCVVWNDDELFARVSDLISDPNRTKQMGDRASEEAAKNDWSVIAPLWESTVLKQIEQLRG